MKKIFVLLILINTISFSQEKFSDFISKIYQESGTDGKTALVDSFIIANQPNGIPYIEDSTAYFIYRGNGSSVKIAGDFNGWSPQLNLSRLSGTDLWYKGQKFEMNARVDYKIVVDDQNWYLDPLNPNTVSGGYGPNSELAMPEYVQPEEVIRNENIPHGTIERISVSSSILNRTYRVDVYLPPNYESSEDVYPSAYVHDGSEYLTLGSAPNVIDNLLYEKKLSPFIGIFVTPTDRGDEYAYGNRYNYAQFIAEELVPKIDAMYRTSKQREDRLVLGTSLGGNISGLISYNYHEVFGKCGMHSSALWVNNMEVYNNYVDNPKIDLDLYAVWGTYENVYEYMRPLKDTLLSKGYNMGWTEYPEGHSWGLWRATLDDMFLYFFPNGYTNSEDEEILPTRIKLNQNYPNPFNPETTIEYEIPNLNVTSVRLSLYNVLGKEIKTLINEKQSPGIHKVTFNGNNLSSGVYFYTLKTPVAQLTKKMILIK
ncbi:MAG: T9SS type A sorting domain-containing protein [Melioribacteraceae bacterium]|nr:T9SS type A sorting domain-containing protein [Melioribacteraceae bacterium]